VTDDRQTDHTTKECALLVLQERSCLIMQHLYSAMESEDTEAPDHARLKQIEWVSF